MTLTSFLDVKADPSKPDETKVDLLANSSANGVNVHEPASALRPPSYSVEYVELYNHRVARRRRLCRIFAWLLTIFLLLDIAAVLYIGLRIRQHEQRRIAGSQSARLYHDGAESSYTCRLRFRGSNGRSDSRTELVSTDRAGRVLVQPSWDSDGRPTILHNPIRGFTLMRAPSARLCFIKHSPWRQHGWTQSVTNWAKESHDVPADSVQFVRLLVHYPAISEHRLMSYGSTAWHMCRGYQTYRVEPMLVRFSVNKLPASGDAADAPTATPATTSKPSAECPMLDCVLHVCPDHEDFLEDENGCQTCQCSSGSGAAKASANRRKRAAPRQPMARPEKGRRLQIDEGVLPNEDGSGSVHVIDVIEF